MDFGYNILNKADFDSTFPDADYGGMLKSPVVDGDDISNQFKNNSEATVGDNGINPEDTSGSTNRS